MFEALTGRSPEYMDFRAQKKFAVIAPYLPETGELLFEVRSPKLDTQPGEVCFPGGRIEPGENPEQAAVRETVEELLIPAGDISVTAPLDTLMTPYYTTIFAYVGTLQHYNFTYNQDEVQQVFTVPFDFFLQNQPEVTYNHITTTPTNPARFSELAGMDPYPWSGAKYPVLFYQYGGQVIWGITARFVNNLVSLYRAGNAKDGPL